MCVRQGEAVCSVFVLLSVGRAQLTVCICVCLCAQRRLCVCARGSACVDFCLRETGRGYISIREPRPVFSHEDTNTCSVAQTYSKRNEQDPQKTKKISSVFVRKSI